MAGSTGTTRENYLTPEELVARWRGRPSLKTLENWRSQGKGPDFFRPARGVVLYRIEDVAAWEASQAVRART